MDNSIIKSWNNKQIRFREDGYACISDMATASNKLTADWLRLKSTNEYLQAFSVAMGIPIAVLLDVANGIESWAHPKVALRFAQWCNVNFAIQVDCWVDELLRTGTVSIGLQQERIDILNLNDRTMYLLNSWEFWRQFPTRKEAYAYFYDPYSPQIGICPPYEAATLDDRLKSMSDFVFEYVIAFDSIRDPRSNAEGRERCLKLLSKDRAQAAKDFQHQLDNPQLLLAGKAIEYPDLASRQRSLKLAAASN